ncbi:hypothetical protein CVT24_002457 [Panaeolus cyanescens]|uniref:Uncharacterized protein n=1 Tax=Panaeolus cyanescens TaxID=181874 RepID=A0A409YZ86_9AGAR|nr:hypothetical protein CVT24_002457 [Panaeolus cyanescens]
MSSQAQPSQAGSGHSTLPPVSVVNTPSPNPTNAPKQFNRYVAQRVLDIRAAEGIDLSQNQLSGVHSESFHPPAPVDASPNNESVYEHLKSFLHYSPTKYQQQADTGSGSTKGFSPYDLHIHKSQQLQRIQVNKDMASILQQYALDFLDDVFPEEARLIKIDEYPHLKLPNFPNPSLRDEKDLLTLMAGVSPKASESEEDSDADACETIIQYAARVASTLVAGSFDIMSTLSFGDRLKIFKVQRHRNRDRAAVPDAEVLAIPFVGISDILSTDLDTLSARTKAPFAPDLVVLFEFKGLVAGSEKAMNDFVWAPLRPWQECPNCSKFQPTTCSVSSRRMFHEAGEQKGPDSGDSMTLLLSRPIDENVGRKTSGSNESAQKQDRMRQQVGDIGYCV